MATIVIDCLAHSIPVKTVVRKWITLIRYVGDNVSPFDLLFLESKFPSWSLVLAEVVRHVAAIAGNTVYGVVINGDDDIRVGIGVSSVADGHRIVTLPTGR